MHIHDRTYAVIMAGGVGSRFWPMSRSARPKQFLDILGTGQSLIQMTFKRMLSEVPAERVLVVTQERYRQLVLAHLPDLPAENVLCEPFMRNTAPCIAYANHVISRREEAYEAAGKGAGRAAVVVAPSDHLILDGAGYNEVVALGLDFARERGALVTLGIKPSRPDTGYGYIQFEGREGSGKDDPRVRSVRTFTEKPNLSTANQFLDSGDFYWNSGIFIWSLSSISKAFEVHLPDMHAAFLERALDFSSPNEGAAIAEIYGDCDNISIDYGIMEKSDDVVCVLSDFGWSDLGTWGALYEKIARDDNDNAVSGGALEATESTGNIVVADPSKLVALRGMKDFIVVDTPDALLVCPRSEEQWVKELVTDLKLSHGEPRV